LDAARASAPDVSILDITMPMLNGLETARELLKRNAAARVIILSLHDTRAFVEQALEAGVRGYLTKETAGRHVVDAIRAVHAGRFFLSPDITHYLVEKAPRAVKRPVRAAQTGALTPQERKVLQGIAEGRSAKEIADHLGLSFNTVRVHRRHLMAKLNLHKAADLARFAVKEGIAKP